jgi:hypothetical protein
MMRVSIIQVHLGLVTLSLTLSDRVSAAYGSGIYNIGQWVIAPEL